MHIISIGSGNYMGAAGWGAAMDAAEGCTALAALDGAPWQQMLRGELDELDLSGRRDPPFPSLCLPLSVSLPPPLTPRSPGPGGRGDAGLAEACATRYLPRSASRLTRLDLRSPTHPHARAHPRTHAPTHTHTHASTRTRTRKHARTHARGEGEGEGEGGSQVIYIYIMYVQYIWRRWPGPGPGPGRLLCLLQRAG